MTGYGKATLELPAKKIHVEIKSLNSKQLDINMRIPSAYKERDLDIRTILSQTVERGKVDFTLHIEYTDATASSGINQEAVKSYYEQIKEIAQNLQINMPTDCFSIILRLPETIKTEIVELDEKEWIAIKKTINKALEEFAAFRIQEGKMLEEIFQTKIKNIKELLIGVDKYEAERIEKIKQRINDSIKKLELSSYDENRFEQEMIFYIERLDINEEKNRLSNHLSYFLETMATENSPGRKLGFIAQEIGREINTLGSKSNHAEMQKIVVKMKDELEQIKEQILNAL